MLDVNYGGSTGYGRAYRGASTASGASSTSTTASTAPATWSTRGQVDGDRLAIRGGSAGGYTTLCALTFTTSSRPAPATTASATWRRWPRDTHKFESRYLDRLIGPYPSAERSTTSARRSTTSSGSSAPVILFQGLDDKVVPPNQAEMMVEALRAKGLPVAYLPFEGEQHGFRQAETIRRRSRRSCTSTAASSASSRPTRSSPWPSRTWTERSAGPRTCGRGRRQSVTSAAPCGLDIDGDLGDQRLDRVEALLPPQPLHEPDPGRLVVEVVVVAVEEVDLEQPVRLVLVDRRAAAERRAPPGWTDPSGRSYQPA